jgi:23S rRNA (pseudouridine1915-N3)-methyltransferase
VRITILSFEKTGKSPYEDQIEEYKKRVRNRFEISERFLREDKLSDTNAIIAPLLEGLRNSTVCVLDQSGESMDTNKFTNLLSRAEEKGRQIVFVIGPHSGLNKPIRFRYDHIISLSPMTFSHQIARLLLFEQLYRGYSIITGHPYNK